jgi:hypothetical protein
VFKPEFRKQVAMRLLNINMKTNSTSVQDLTDRDWPHVMLASMKAVMNEDLIGSSWKKEGVVPFTRAPEKYLRAEEVEKEKRLDGAFSTHLLAPKVTVPTPFGAVPVMVPKETNRAREGLARALNGVQKTTVSVEDLEAFKVKLLQKLENQESIGSEDILQLHSLGEKAAKERDEIKTATENFIRSEAPKARASDLFSIPGGVNSTMGLARIQLAASNAEERASLVASRKKEKEEKQTAKAAKAEEELENELETAAQVKTEFLNKIRKQGPAAWNQLSHLSAKKLYLAKMKNRPDRNLRKSELIETLKDLYKDECNVGSLDEPDWT